jgi:hypothetical protein
MWKSLSDADFGGTISIEELSENIVKLTIIENKLFVQS